MDMSKQHPLVNLPYVNRFVNKAIDGEGDSDRHLITLFSIALASKGKTYVELGVREGHTTEPLYQAAFLNHGKLYSVDLNKPTEFNPPNDTSNYQFVKGDSIQFLEEWPKHIKMDVVFVDDWHSYPHVKRQLELLDECVGPSSVILLHDLMYGNTDPFYHADLSHGGPQWDEGGPYRAVAELNPQFWEWSTLPWNNGLTILRKKYSNNYHRR